MEITPNQASADYRWLWEHGFWDEVSFKDFAAKYWQPMLEDFFLTEMSCRIKFQEGSKPWRMALALHVQRENLENYFLHVENYLQLGVAKELKTSTMGTIEAGDGPQDAPGSALRETD